MLERSRAMLDVNFQTETLPEKAIKQYDQFNIARVMLKDESGYGVYCSRRVRLFKMGGENYSVPTPTTPKEESGRRFPVGYWYYVDGNGRALKRI